MARGRKRRGTSRKEACDASDPIVQAPVPTHREDWDGVMPSKASEATVLGLMRDAQTPLNTPYTPHLVKMQMSEQRAAEEAAGEMGVDDDMLLEHVVPRARSALALGMRQVQWISTRVDQMLGKALPEAVQRSSVFTQHRETVSVAVTALLGVPALAMAVPFFTAVGLMTSPLWFTGLTIWGARELVHRCRGNKEEKHETHRPKHARVNGMGEQNPNALYARTILREQAEMEE